MITVAIADDQALVRQGVRVMLNRADDIKVVGEAEDGLQAVKLCKRIAPDVLVIDISMPRMNGIQAIARISGGGKRQPHTRALILSMHMDAYLIHRALEVGASGYLLKRTGAEELIRAIRKVAQGSTYLSPEVSKFLGSATVSSRQEPSQEIPVDRLTPRECTVLRRMAEGYTCYEIAAMLKVTVKTVQKHRANLMRKLDIQDVAGLPLAAIKYGLTQIGC